MRQFQCGSEVVHAMPSCGALRDGAVVVDMLEAREMCCSVCADVGDVASGLSGICESCETPVTTFTSPPGVEISALIIPTVENCKPCVPDNKEGVILRETNLTKPPHQSRQATDQAAYSLCEGGMQAIPGPPIRASRSRH